MAYTFEDWKIVREFYERGMKIPTIVEQEDVVISKTQIDRRSKAENWQRLDEKRELVEQEAAARHEVRKIRKAKEEMPRTELIVHNAMVDQRTKLLDYFDKKQMRITEVSMKYLEDRIFLDEDGNEDTTRMFPADLTAVASSVSTCRKSILQEDKNQVNVQVNNGLAPKIVFEVIE